MQEMQETWIQPLGREDPLEEEMATHSSILAWTVPWTEEPDGLRSMGSQGIRHSRALTRTLSHVISDGRRVRDNGQHLQRL